MLPTSAMRTWAVRTFSRIFRASSRASNGSSSRLLALTSAGSAYPPARSRKSPAARHPAAAASTRASLAIRTYVSRAWTGILLPVAKKTDSAGWLEVLLPGSWNQVGNRARCPFKSAKLLSRIVAWLKFVGAQFRSELDEPIWSKTDGRAPFQGSDNKTLSHFRDSVRVGARRAISPSVCAFPMTNQGG